MAGDRRLFLKICILRNKQGGIHLDASLWISLRFWHQSQQAGLAGGAENEFLPLIFYAPSRSIVLIKDHSGIGACWRINYDWPKESDRAIFVDEHPAKRLNAHQQK
jgi:hypothetical protein